MHCERARSLLFDLVDGRLTGNAQAELEAHLDQCDVCQADHESIVEMRTLASTWHDLPAPAGEPPPLRPRAPAGGSMALLIRDWFPAVASSAALALVLALYLAPPGPPGPAANPALERRQELETVVRLVMAEMDRRAEETEDSLRYVIEHQLRDQRALDELYQRVEQISYQPRGGGEPM